MGRLEWIGWNRTSSAAALNPATHVRASNWVGPAAHMDAGRILDAYEPTATRLRCDVKVPRNPRQLEGFKNKCGSRFYPGSTLRLQATCPLKVRMTSLESAQIRVIGIGTVTRADVQQFRLANWMGSNHLPPDRRRQRPSALPGELQVADRPMPHVWGLRQAGRSRSAGTAWTPKAPTGQPWSCLRICSQTPPHRPIKRPRQRGSLFCAPKRIDAQNLVVTRRRIHHPSVPTGQVVDRCGISPARIQRIQ